jgi:hypothetical protein
MRLFRRKSKWDHVRDIVVATIASGGLRRLTKVTAGVIGGAAAATVASAAVSSIRHKDES